MIRNVIPNFLTLSIIINITAAGFGKFFSVFKSFGIYLTKLENLKGFFSRLILTFYAFCDKILYNGKIEDISNSDCRKTEKIMIKPQKTVIMETLFVAIFTFGLSAMMNAIFVALKNWDYTVLTGSLLSSVASTLNFYIMGIVVQGIIANKSLEPKDRQQRVKLSFTLRMIGLAAVVALGVALPWFNTWAVVIPIFFPRIAMLFRPLFGKGNITSGTVKVETPDEEEKEIIEGKPVGELAKTSTENLTENLTENEETEETEE